MNPIFDNLNLSRRSMHLLFWSAWVFSFTFIKSIGYSVPAYFDWLIYYILTLPIFVAHTYLVAYWLIPRYFFTKKYVLFGTIAFLLLLLFSVLELVFSNELIFGRLSRSIRPEVAYLNLKNIIISGIGNHYIIILFLSIKALKYWYTAENMKNELHKDTLEAEMKLLRNQLHPRFLLNTMDLLEKMAVEKSEKTPELIIRISNLLGNILLKNTDDMICLRREVNLIESFLDIQKLVKFTKIDAQILRSGDLESIKVPALSFFPLVEHILSLFDENETKQVLKIFIRSENNYLLFFSSFICCEEDPHEKLKPIMEKTKDRLSFYYGSNCRFLYEYENIQSELSCEIFTHAYHA